MRGLRASVVRRRLIARWIAAAAGRVVVFWGERRGSSRGRGIEAHMYRPFFFAANRIYSLACACEGMPFW
jgi:hypothetical protein